MTDYQSELRRLSCRIEFLRQEMAAKMDAGEDVAELHEELAQLMTDRTALALAENMNETAAAWDDIDTAQAEAQATQKGR